MVFWVLSFRSHPSANPKVMGSTQSKIIQRSFLAIELWEFLSLLRASDFFVNNSFPISWKHGDLPNPWSTACGCCRMSTRTDDSAPIHILYVRGLRTIASWSLDLARVPLSRVPPTDINVSGINLSWNRLPRSKSMSFNLIDVIRMPIEPIYCPNRATNHRNEMLLWFPSWWRQADTVSWASAAPRVPLVS